MDKASLKPVRLLAVMALVSLWALGATAQAPTLKTINVDGNLSDWDEVLLNPAQVTLDGDGSSVPCVYSTDLDCIVQATGRDLRKFAWTYDATYIYFYVQRQGSSSNEQVFWFYMDLDADGLMGAADRVMRVRFNGSTGVTQNDLYRYVPVALGGDPMVDAGGLGDGYTLPGNLSSTSTWTEGVPNGGSADGGAFEERLPWAELGVAPGSGLDFHVASSNSPNPSNLASQVDDNLGGPGGGSGTFAFDLVEVTPDTAGTVRPNGVATYAHVIENTGTRANTFQIQVQSTLGLAVSLYRDTNGDGIGDVLMATDANGDGDFGDVGDFLDPAFDTDADGLPDTGPLAPGETFAVVVSIQTLVANDGQEDVTTLTTFLTEKPDIVRDTAVDTTTIGRIAVRSPDPDKNSVDAQNVNYTVSVCNNTTPDTIDLSLVSTFGWQVSLYSDPECDGVRNDFLAQDTNGDGVWTTVLSGDTDGDGLPDTGFLATGECACFVVEVQVRRNSIIGTVDTTTVRASGSSPIDRGELDLHTTVTARLELFPDYTFALQTEKVSGANKPVYFAHVAQNNWLVPDRVVFTTVPPTNTAGWTVRIWSDPNGDGNIFDGAVITQTDLIAPNGGELHFVVEVRVPAGVPSGTTNTTVVTGTAGLDARVRDTVTDELEVSSIATYSDALFSLPTTFFAPCTTIYVEGTGLERDRGGQFEDIYDLLYFDAARRNVRFHDPFVPDLNGVATDFYAMQGPDLPGAWTIELRELTLTIASLGVTVEANGLIDPLTTSVPLYPLVGAPLGVNSRLTNQNTRAAFSGTTVEYVVLDPTQTMYLVSGAPSTFLPYTGTEVTRTQSVPNLTPGRFFDDPFTIPAVTYPTQGVYTIRATWRASCGMVITVRETTFIVGDGEIDCANVFDDDGDTFVDCADPECARDPACFEVDCTDGNDGDGDTLFDCDDPDCATAPNCIPETPCSDGNDNDGDTLTDCEDPDCVTDPACPEQDCADGIDGDGDTLIDCLDPDCASDPACIESDCANGLDDDGDTTFDCSDTDCLSDPNCGPENCTDGIDNDGDLAVDCLDADCAGHPACTEAGAECSDLVDNDNDGNTDCRDSDCFGVPDCIETGSECEDTVDNDGDNDIDCFDADCIAWPPCQGNDTDGDTIPDPQDCAPTDIDTWFIPDEVPRDEPDHLTVTKPAGTTDALVSWSPPAISPGNLTVYDVVRGTISQLWADAGFANIQCFSGDQSALSVTDSALTGGNGDGFYYLVRADNACGPGAWGVDSTGRERIINPPAPCD